MDTQTDELVPVPNPVSTPSTSALAAALGFFRQYWASVVAISAAVTIPCFWHRHIEAGDLASHTYNAWLAQLIERGQAPGLWLNRQSNNILFDLVLTRLGTIVGLRAAEKIAVSAAVLIFFWGAFALVCAMARRIPWFLLPCLAIFAYGWTFEEGLMNYYISIGLAFFGLALIVRGRGWERAWTVILAPLIWSAHPLGVFLLVSGAAYILLARYLPQKSRAYLFAAAALLLLATHFCLRVRVHHGAYAKGHFGVTWRADPWQIQDGSDQLLLYGSRYSLPAHLLQVFLCVCFLVDIVRRRHCHRWWSSYLLPAELYALALLTTALLPAGVRAPHMTAPLLEITERLTSVTAILICCLLGVMQPRKWHLVGFAAIAALFFSFLYKDTATINQIEEQAERYVQLLPYGQRVIAPLLPFREATNSFEHIVDRACIEHCFSYDNYEPSTGQFRVRVESENPFVMADQDAANAASQGREYIVKRQDLPVSEIYQCDRSRTQLCIRELTAGENTADVVRGIR